MKNIAKSIIVALTISSSKAFSFYLPIPIPVIDYLPQQVVPGIQKLTLSHGGQAIVTYINGRKTVLHLEGSITIEDGVIYRIEAIKINGSLKVSYIQKQRKSGIILTPKKKFQSLSKLKPGDKVSLLGEFIITL